MRLLLLFTLLLALPASAQRLTVPGQADPFAAQVAQSWPLVTRDNGENFLRVSLQLLGPFPATDVSPPYELVLSMYTLFPRMGHGRGSMVTRLRLISQGTSPG